MGPRVKFHIGSLWRKRCRREERDETKWLPDCLKPKEFEKLRGVRTQHGRPGEPEQACAFEGPLW